MSQEPMIVAGGGRACWSGGEVSVGCVARGRVVCQAAEVRYFWRTQTCLAATKLALHSFWHATDRQALGKITGEGVFLEALERNPGQYLPDVTHEQLSTDVVKVRSLGEEGAEEAGTERVRRG